MADMSMVKRPARHIGEVGLFVDSPLFEEEMATIRQGAEVSVTATQSRSLKQMRLAWGLCRKIADSGALGDADTREVMQYLLLKAKHVRYVTNVHKDGTEITPIVKSIRFASMDQTAFSRLFERMLWIVSTDILPEVPDATIRAEIEQMAGVGVPEPEPKAAPKRRRAPAPEKVSVIPATEPVTTAVPQGQPNPPAPTPTEGAGTNSDAVPPSPPASAKPASSPPPAAQAPEATPATIPTNAAAWKVWCRTWLDEALADPEITDMDVLSRWSAETKVRNSCGITSETRADNFAYMNKIVERKRKQQAKRQA